MRSPEPVAVVMRSDPHCEKEQRDEAKRRADEIHHVEREVLSYHAAACDSDAYAHVPGGEIGACGGGSLVVRRKIDVQGVHRREHYAEAIDLLKNARDGASLNLLGVAYYKSGQADKAEETFARAVEAGYGDAGGNLKQLQEAKALFSE